MYPYVVHALRWLLGALFLFSGATKSIDPVGTSIFVEKYLSTYALEGLLPAALAIGVALAVVEFTVGAMLVGGVMQRRTSLLALVMVALFSVVTLLSATVLPIGDCGCFGEVVSLTPWGTFVKNVVLLPIAYVVWRGAERRQMKLGDAAIVVVAIALSLGVNLYAMRHQPLVDLMPYKVGTDLREAVARERMNDDVRSILRFRNSVTGEVEEFSADATECWMREELEYVDTRTISDATKDAKYADFRLYDADGENVSSELLARSGRVVWLTIYSVDGLKPSHLDAICRLREAYPMSSIFVLTADNNLDIEELGDDTIYNIDAMTLRSINRSTVGVVVLNDGVVEYKADIRDI